jgi:erythromycin esterase-like protein
MGMRTMGQHLASTHGKEMVVFGFATGRGTYTAMEAGGGLKRDHALLEPRAGSVEALFEAAGVPIAVVDVRSGAEWTRTSMPIRSIGALATPMQFFPCVPAEMFDVLVWQAVTTASREMK